MKQKAKSLVAYHHSTPSKSYSQRTEYFVFPFFLKTFLPIWMPRQQCSPLLSKTAVAGSGQEKRIFFHLRPLFSQATRVRLVCDRFVGTVPHIRPSHSCPFSTARARKPTIPFPLGVIANADGALSGDAVGPETVNGDGAARHGVVRRQQPEAEDGLGEDVEDAVGDDLGVDVGQTRAVADAPDTARMSVLLSPQHINLPFVYVGRGFIRRTGYVHGVGRPQDQGVAGNEAEEDLGLLVLVGDGGAAIEAELVDDDEVGDAGDCVVAPLLAVALAEGREQAGETHGDVGEDGDEHAGPVEAGQEAEVQQQQGRRQRPLYE